jgi:integrase/recombinase XerD
MAGRKQGTTGKARVLDEKELRQVLRIVEIGNHPKRNTAVLILSHFLGLRAKELAALKIGDVIEDRQLKKVLRLLAAYTKGSKHRDISIENKIVIKALTELVAERRVEDGATFSVNAPLFRSQKQSAFTPNTMARLLGEIYSKAGFKDATSHSGRRSLITKLAYAGYDVNSIRQIAGHSSIATTQRYIEDNPYVIAEILKSI